MNHIDLPDVVLAAGRRFTVIPCSFTVTFPACSLLVPCSEFAPARRKAHGIKGLSACGDQKHEIFGNYILDSLEGIKYHLCMSKSTISTFQIFSMFPDKESARIYLESRLWPEGA